MVNNVGIFRLPDELLGNVFQHLSSQEVTAFLHTHHTHGCAREQMWKHVTLLPDGRDDVPRAWPVNRYLKRVRELNRIVTGKSDLPIQDLTVAVPRHRKLSWSQDGNSTFVVPEVWYSLDFKKMLKSLFKLKSLRLESYVLPPLVLRHPEQNHTLEAWLKYVRSSISALPAEPIQIPDSVAALYLNDTKFTHLWSEPASEVELRQMMLLQRVQGVGNVTNLTLRMACPLQLDLFSSLFANLRKFSALQSFTFICIEVPLVRESVGTILKHLSPTCHTFELLYAPQVEHAFPEDWPELAPNLRTVRVPTRSINDPIAGTKPTDDINFESLLDPREFADPSPFACKSFSLAPLIRERRVNSSLAQAIANRWNAARGQASERRRLVVVDADMPSRASDGHQRPGDVPRWMSFFPDRANALKEKYDADMKLCRALSCTRVGRCEEHNGAGSTTGKQ